MILATGWEHARIGDFSLVFDETAPPPTGSSQTIVVTGTKSHVDLAAVMGTGRFTAFAAALQTALNASPLTGTFTVSFSTTTLLYTVSSTVPFWTANPSGTVAGHILGRTAAAVNVSSFVSTIRPYYVIGCEAVGVSEDPCDDFEPDDLVEGGVTKSGRPFAIDQRSGVYLHDFTIPGETYEATFRRKADPAVPWTYQHMIEHARGSMPFLLVDDAASESTVLKLRKEFARWKARRLRADWNGRWDIPLGCYVLGRL